MDLFAVFVHFTMISKVMATAIDGIFWFSD